MVIDRPAAAPAPASVAPGGSVRDSRSRWVTALLVLASLGVLVLIAVQIFLHQNAPQREGMLRIAGLSANVRVERDHLAVPRIHAANRCDAIEALGFLHGQERFFQMDMQRRTAAGEQAELIGPTMVPADLTHRLHQFRRRAAAETTRLRADDRQLLEAYTRGVNAGLASHRVRPAEYIILGVKPAPWRLEDSLLVGYSLFFALQNPLDDADYVRGLMERQLAPEVYSYLFENGGHRGSTLDGSETPIREPSPAVLQAVSRSAGATHPEADAAPLPVVERPAPGSNGWAVSGALTGTGHAMLANDLHLPLVMPAIWYRAELDYGEQGGARHRVVGITLPGLPMFIAGSNGQLAWGVTNASIDTLDLVKLELRPDQPDHYLTPGGWEKITEQTETIRVRGSDPVPLKIRQTIWGPINPVRAYPGEPLVLRWSAHEPNTVNLRLLDLEAAKDVENGLAAANNVRIVPLNFLLADAYGGIAWTLLGWLPARAGFDGTVPVSFSDGARSWAGELDRQDVPTIVNPPDGRIWNANNYSVARTPAIGNGGFDTGGRATQIEGALFAASSFTERDFLKIQHDDAANFLRRWAVLVQQTARGKNRLSSERRAELLRLISEWDGHASVTSGAYGVVRDFRLSTIRAVVNRLTGPEGWPAGLGMDPFDFEEPTWMLIAPPADLGVASPLPATFLADVLEKILRDSDARWGEKTPLANRPWGARNRLDATHPLSALHPKLGRWLDLPHSLQAGDDHMPLVTAPRFGAAIRLVVTPGAEARGLVQLPGGQSGDPLSPHYDDQFENWRTMQGNPLLPGATKYELILKPAVTK